MNPQDAQDTSEVLELYLAWIDFKSTHNLKDVKIACCPRTTRLFDALERFEKMVTE